MNNLEEVINDSISDAELPKEEPETDVAEAGPSADPTPSEPVAEEPSIEVASPAAKAAAATDPEEDEFAKKYGVPATSASGRENRLPHSRVRKMVEKAEKETAAKLTAEHTKVLTEHQAKIQDYETRLKEVDAFEQVMTNDPNRFLEMLATIPAYQSFFQWVQQAAQAAPGGTPVVPGGAQASPATSDMPGPNKELPDGSRMYDDEGIRALLDWQHKRTLGEIEGKLSKEYEPIRQQWEAQQYMARMAPEVEKKIAAAREWHLFKENEEEIAKLLAQYPDATLEQAYMHVVQPKLAVDKTRIREEVIADMKRKNGKASTSVSTTASHPGPSTPGGRRSIEDIIQEQVDKLKG